MAEASLGCELRIYVDQSQDMAELLQILHQVISVEDGFTQNCTRFTNLLSIKIMLAKKWCAV
jgi:hypothetical protein